VDFANKYAIGTIGRPKLICTDIKFLVQVRKQQYKVKADSLNSKDSKK
jgi:hypothetical protein